jgi:frataxin-like iron-binding protein CyaY
VALETHPRKGTHLTDPRHLDLLAQALAAVAQHGSEAEAARALGIPRETLRGRVAKARMLGVKPGGVVTAAGASEVDVALLRDQVRTLQAQLREARAERLDEEYVKRQIVGLAEAKVEPPEWLVRVPKRGRVTGVPTLLVSDLHWGERVSAAEVAGLNSYDIGIAQRRMRTMIETTIGLLKERFANPEYPGIVMACAGDFVGGDILHDELLATNEDSIMPVVLDLWGVLVWCIKTLADEFGNVFVPCVTGNHGRSTKKLWAKRRNATNFDWLIYQFLAKHFEGDKRVSFLIPDGPDAYYRIFEHRYLLCHGDAFKGGDSIIGALGPLARGDAKKRGRNSQVGMDYDTMVCGHWHQLLQLRRLICNGSLKGLDEYAYSMNFPIEEPLQALWLTSPRRGITFSMPVQVEQQRAAEPTAPWVSVKSP